LPSALPDSGDLLVLGLMSGTSLDGLDIVLVRFEWNKKMEFEVQSAKTFEYSQEWKERLGASMTLSGLELQQLDVDLARWMSSRVIEFLEKGSKIKVEFLASHGHTIFHQPESGFTSQIGSGAILSILTGIPVVCDFRSQDVALGGQGAPLVPKGDQDLFGDFAACVNLGGFANISSVRGNERVAWDICPVNVVLNSLAKKEGLDFDKDGKLASKGSLIQPLFDELESLEYYQLHAPKSLGMEWVKVHVRPLMEKFKKSPTKDILRTYCEHVASQISKSLENVEGDVLFTGGGVWNAFLMKRISDLSSCKVKIPKRQIVDFKEAIIFAYLGLLRWYGLENVKSSVTGSKSDHSAGAIYLA
jgi:anhydro-N-acetylmuramic acid kinase